MSLETFGAIDILVNNAVVRYAAPVEQFPVGEWDLGIAVNLSAAFHTIRLALPAMRRRNWGRIINVSSIYGLIGDVNRLSYVTSKTALIGMTRAVALETRGSGYHLQRGMPRDGGNAGAHQTDRTHDGSRISLARRSGTAIPGEQAARRALYQRRRRSRHDCSFCADRKAATSPARRCRSTAGGPSVERAARYPPNSRAGPRASLLKICPRTSSPPPNCA